MAEVEIMNRRNLYSNKPPGLRNYAYEPVGISSQGSLPSSSMMASKPATHSSAYNLSPKPSGAISVSNTTLEIMSEISEICDGLYLCGARGIKLSRLRELGMTTVVNVSIELPSLLLDQVEYIKINVEDSPYSNLSYHFDKVADKIEEVRRRGGNTLVHCVAGVSRSATLCIAYLMKYRRLSLKKAYLHVKAMRPIIRPNIGFFRQLVEYEQRLFGITTVSMVWNSAAGGHIPDLYEPEYNNTVMFLQKYGLQNDRLGRYPNQMIRR